MVKTLIVEEPTYWNIKDAQTILEKKGIKYTLPEMLDVIIPSIEDMIKKIEKNEEALIEIHYGFPIIQLIEFQKGKCYNTTHNTKDCCNDLNAPKKVSPLEDYQALSHQAMKLDDIDDDYNIIGHDHGYRLFCQKCSGFE